MERRRSASEQRPAQPNEPCPQRGNSSGDGSEDHARRRPRSVGRSTSLRRTQAAASARASLPPPLLLVLLLGVCLATAGADLASMGALPPPFLPQVPPYFINQSHVGFRCAMMHTCDLPGSDEFRGCSCHPSCSLFGTCCADARPPDWRQRAMPADLYVCASPVPWSSSLYDFQPNHTLYTHSMGSMVVNKCPGASGSDNSSGNVSSYLRALCAHPLQRTGDGVLSTLVMANISQVSYRNVFCALCHNENVSAVTPWRVVNITIPQKYDYRWRGGQVRIGFLAPDESNVASCRLNMVTGCSDPNAHKYREACENEPTAFVFDNWDVLTFRNWNCSACNGRPSGNCMFTRFVYDYWSPNGPEAIPISSAADNGNSTEIDVDPLCPGHLNVTLSAAERTFWLNRCPSLATATVDRPLCSAWLNASDLIVLYHNASTVAADASVGGNASARAMVTYGIASHYVWLSLPGVEAAEDAGNGRLAPVVCASCVAWQQAVPCVVPCTSEATHRRDSRGNDDENATLTIDGTTYQKPFFVKRSTECKVVICSEFDPNALAALSASSDRFGDRLAFRSIAVAIALRAASRICFVQ